MNLNPIAGSVQSGEALLRARKARAPQSRPGTKTFACLHKSKGTRITVSDVLEYLASGMNEQAILADFPELRREHIQAVLGFAAERERRLSALPAVS
jgi:hypothetical protein